MKTSSIVTPAAQAALANSMSFGTHISSQLVFAVEWLKDRREPKTFDDIIDHLSLRAMEEPKLKAFASLLKQHTRTEYRPSKKIRPSDPHAWRAGTYEFRAKIPGVKDERSLLQHLQEKRDYSGVSVKDLKDGWPDCEKAITELEAQHKILVVRTKKDGYAKSVWEDQPQFFHRVDPEFQSMWHKCALPSTDDIVRKLQALGQKPASEDPRLKKMETAKSGVKKRKARPPKNQSNQHMAHLLKDFSHLKR